MHIFIWVCRMNVTSMPSQDLDESLVWDPQVSLLYVDIHTHTPSYHCININALMDL